MMEIRYFNGFSWILRNQYIEEDFENGYIDDFYMEITMD